MMNIVTRHFPEKLSGVQVRTGNVNLCASCKMTFRPNIFGKRKICNAKTRKYFWRSYVAYLIKSLTK